MVIERAAGEAWTVVVGACGWSQNGAGRKHRQAGGSGQVIPNAPCLLARLVIPKALQSS